MKAICLCSLALACPGVAITPSLFNEQSVDAKQFILIRQSAKDSQSIKGSVHLMNTNGYSNLAPDLWIDVRKSSFAMENLKKDAKAGEYIKNAGFYSVSGNPKRVEEIFPKANSTIDWVFDASDKYWLCRLSNTKKLAIMNPSTGEIAITDAKPSNLSVEIFPMGHYCYLIQSAVYSEEAGYSREIWVFDSNVGSLKLALEAQTESADIELEDHDNDGFYETLVFPVDGPSGQNENETDIYTFKNNKFIESKK